MIPVSQPSPFSITPQVVQPTCTNNGSVILTNVSGATPPYQYLWSTGETTIGISQLAPGNYSVIVTDANNCTASFSYLLSQPQPIADNADIQTPFCTSNGRIVLSPTGGTPPYQFSWNTGSTNQSITSIGAGNYSVIVTDANNCTASFSYSLTETECFVTPSSYFTPNGDTYNDTWQIANAQYFDNIHLIVFDRWGTRVHEQKGTYELWDGKSYLGIPVPDAVYYYFFYQEKDDKQKEAKRGSVTILR